MSDLIIRIEDVDEGDRQFAVKDLNPKKVSRGVKKITNHWQRIQDNPNLLNTNAVTPMERLDEDAANLNAMMRTRIGSRNNGYGLFAVLNGSAIDYAVMTQISNLIRVLIDVKYIATNERETVDGAHGRGRQHKSVLMQWGQSESRHRVLTLNTPHGKTREDTLLNMYETMGVSDRSLHSNKILDREFNSSFETWIRKRGSRSLCVKPMDNTLPAPMYYSLQRGITPNGLREKSRDYPLTYHPRAAEIVRNVIHECEILGVLVDGFHEKRLAADESL